MDQKKSGFTLIELMVVVLIVGILAVVAVPQYLKTVETSKATDAVGLVMMIGNANRMYKIDNGVLAAGIITGNTHPLIANKYMADHDWGTATTGTPYYYYACNGGAGGACCGGTAAACALRKSGTYINWGYRVSDAGVCSELTTDTPKCPGM